MSQRIVRSAAQRWCRFPAACLRARYGVVRIIEARVEVDVGGIRPPGLLWSVVAVQKMPVSIVGPSQIFVRLSVKA